MENTVSSFILQTLQTQSGSKGWFGTGQSAGSAGYIVQGIICLILTTIAISIFIKAFWPGILETNRTNNTVGINKLMMILHCITGTLFGLGALAMAISMWAGNTHVTWSNNWDVGVMQIMYFLHNIGVALGLSRVVYLKTKNMKDAAALGLEETDYYSKYIAGSGQLVKKQ